MDWYKTWQKNNYFEVENNVLKKNQLVTTNFIKSNHLGFLHADFRPYLYADSLARYYRFKGLNVINTIGFDTQSYSSFLTGNHLNKNQDLLEAYLTELAKLNIGYPKNKLICNNELDIMTLIEKFVVYLFNKGVIKYKDYHIYKEENKLYDEISLTNGHDLVNEKVLVLDFSNYLDNITKHLAELNLTENDKEYLLNKLKAYTSLVITLMTTNKKEFKIKLTKPEELASLTAIIINPNYVDILEYISPREIFAVENYLIHKHKKYLFTGNYSTNPLTGKQIPIFIGDSYDMAIKPLFSIEDKEVILELGLDIIDIYDGSYLINSDFLNGLTKEEARLKIVETFKEEGIATSYQTYAKKEILISSLDKYGAIFPLALKNNNLILLEKQIPLYYNKNGQIKMNNEKDLPIVKLLDFTINHHFLKGIELLLPVLYTKFQDTEILSQDVIKDIKKWYNNLCIIVNRNDLVNNLLLPIIFISIIEKEENLELLKQAEIIMAAPVYDEYGNNIKRSNNNCIKVNDIIAAYGADALRLYYFSTKIDEPLYFSENKIFAYKQFINRIKAIYKRGFLASNYNLEFPLYQLQNKLYDALVSLDLTKYITYLEEFINNYLLNETLTKKQGITLLTLISIVCPCLAEDINYEEIHAKQLAVDAVWPL